MCHAAAGAVVVQATLPWAAAWHLGLLYCIYTHMHPPIHWHQAGEGQGGSAADGKGNERGYPPRL